MQIIMAVPIRVQLRRIDLRAMVGTERVEKMLMRRRSRESGYMTRMNISSTFNCFLVCKLGEESIHQETREGGVVIWQ